MCHNCHLVIVDTKEDIKAAQEAEKEIKKLMLLKFIQLNKKVYKDLEKLLKDVLVFIEEVKKIDGTQGTADYVLKLNTKFKNSLKKIHKIKTDSHSKAVNNFFKSEREVAWIGKYLESEETSVILEILKKLKDSTEETFKNELQKFKDKENFANEFRKMKLNYIQNINENKRIFEVQKKSFREQVINCKKIEEFEKLKEHIESREFQNKWLMIQRNKIIDQVNEIGMKIDASFEDYEIHHDSETNVSKIVFKLKKEENDDMVTFVIDDNGDTKYILGDYHTQDYVGENALEREEKDLNDIFDLLKKEKYVLSKPNFQSRFGFHSHESFRKLKEREMK